MPEKYRPEGSTVEYVVPSLDDPADGPEAFRDFADSIPKSLSSAIPVTNVTADYTLKATDEGSLITFDCTAKDLTVTIPTDTAVPTPIGTCIVVGCLGTNRKSSLTINAADGVTLRDLAVRKVLWSRMAALIKIDANSWIINAGTGGGTPTSVPSPPTLLTCAAGTMQIGVTWKAPTDDGGASISAYLVEISTDQKVWDTGASASPTALAANVPVAKGGVTYYLRTRAVNANGVSEPSNVKSADVKAPFNEAIGGTETFYEKDGKHFKVHTFKADGTLTVLQSVSPFRVLCVGGGSNGGGGGPYCAVGPRGASGEAVEITSVNLPAQSYPVAVGGPGAQSSVSTVIARGAANTGRMSSDITGTATSYPASGGSDGPCGSDGNQRGGNGTFPGGEGGGGGGIGNESPFQPGPGGSGAPGVVIVSYEVSP